jgi:hypothetical protein
MKIRVSNSLFVILVSAVLWQPVSAAADSYDPPARVARLSYSRGSVSFQPAGDSEWVDAVLNLPIVTGDNLWAGENSRAEVRIGSKAIRLGLCGLTRWVAHTLTIILLPKARSTAELASGPFGPMPLGNRPGDWSRFIPAYE